MHGMVIARLSEWAIASSVPVKVSVPLFISLVNPRQFFLFPSPPASPVVTRAYVFGNTVVKIHPSSGQCLMFDGSRSKQWTNLTKNRDSRRLGSQNRRLL